MKQIIYRYSIYGIFAIILGCGTRKAESEKTTLSLKDNTTISNEGSNDATNVITTQDQALNINSNQNKTTETNITTEYDKNTGVVVKRSETSKTGQEYNLTINNTIHTTDKYVRTVVTWKIKQIVIHELKTLNKTKTVTSDRNGFYYVCAFAVLIAGIIAFLKIPRRASV